MRINMLVRWSCPTEEPDATFWRTVSIQLTTVSVADCAISLLALKGDVTGVTYHGLRYTISDETVVFGSSLGMSNEVHPEAEEISVSIESGLAVLFVTPLDK